MQIDFIKCCALSLVLDKIECVHPINGGYNVVFSGNNGNTCTAQSGVNITMQDNATSLATGYIGGVTPNSISNGAFTIIAYFSITDPNVAVVNICLEVIDPCTGLSCYECVQAPIPPCGKMGNGVSNAKTKPLPNNITLDEKIGFVLMPNPASNSCKVQYQLNDHTVGAKIVVYNTLGQLVYAQILPQALSQSTSGNVVLPLQGLCSGLYTVQLQQNNAAVYSQKLIVEAP